MRFRVISETICLSRLWRLWGERMRKTKRILSLVLCLWMLLQTFAVLMLPASAETGAEAMDASHVTDDLDVMNVDRKKYPKDASDDRVEILKFIEFGYKANGDFSEYGLYLYLYNPSGKLITGNNQNCVQLAYAPVSGAVTSYYKYPLKILSWSTEEGYERVYWKVKVVGAEDIAPRLNKALREYRISGVEILRAGNSNATDYCFGGGTFKFSGYHRGCQSNEYSTLRCRAEKMDVVELVLHPVTYYFEKNSGGSRYKVYDEVFGVYFSVPKIIVQRYGNLTDENLKGLDSVKGCYREGEVNGILTDSSTLAGLFRNPNINANDIYFRCEAGTRSDSADYYYRVTENCKDYLSKLDFVSETIPDFRRSNIIETSNSIDGVSASDFAKWYAESGKNALWRSNLLYYTITKDDIGKAEQYVGFWRAIGNFFKRKGSTETVSFDALQYLSGSEAGSLDAKGISEKFKVTEVDAEALKSFALKSGDAYTYVMHFAVRESETVKVTDAGTLDRDAWFDYFDEIKGIGNSYYFQKTVFEDFDVLELTFRDEENKLSVVPVSASPIDVTGGIVSPIADDPNEKPGTGTSFWQTLLKVVAVIAIIVLLIFIVRLFGGFGAVFGAIGRGMTRLYQSAQKRFQSWRNDWKKKKQQNKKKKENQS